MIYREWSPHCMKYTPTKILLKQPLLLIPPPHTFSHEFLGVFSAVTLRLIYLHRVKACTRPSFLLCFEHHEGKYILFLVAEKLLKDKLQNYKRSCLAYTYGVNRNVFLLFSSRQNIMQLCATVLLLFFSLFLARV